MTDIPATTTTRSGIGFTGLLTVLFIGLKLGHVITWSWLWVLSPIWISLGVFLIVFLITLTVFVVAAVRPR